MIALSADPVLWYHCHTNEKKTRTMKDVQIDQTAMTALPYDPTDVSHLLRHASTTVSNSENSNGDFDHIHTVSINPHDQHPANSNSA